MKKFAGVAAVAVLLIPLVAFGAEFRAGDQPDTKLGETIQDDVYLAGGSVTSAGTVTGDAVAAGGNVVINGPVGADVMAAGGNVTILSNVGDDVRAAGGNVIVQGSVGGDVIAAGGQVTLQGSVGGDAAIGGGTIRIEGPIEGDVHIGGGKVYIDAPINGTVTVEADTLTLGHNAALKGITYRASKELVREDGAVISGPINYTPRPARASPAAAAALFSAFALGKFLSLLACSLLVGLLLRRYSRQIVERVAERPLLELGRGLLTFAALPVISVILLITIIGIPLGILGLIGFVALLIVGWIVTPIIIGSFVYNFARGVWEVNWLTILIGAILYTILGFIPFLGSLAQFLLMLLALGAITAIKLRLIRDWR
jgi:hypothetical protein